MSETGRAVLIAVVATVVGQAVMALLTEGLTLVAMGVSQLVYLGPLAIVAYRRDRKTALKVYAITAGVVLLVNAACWGIAAASFR